MSDCAYSLPAWSIRARAAVYSLDHAEGGPGAGLAGLMGHARPLHQWAGAAPQPIPRAPIGGPWVRRSEGSPSGMTPFVRE